MPEPNEAIEREKLEIEKQRVAIEQERLAIERQRVVEEGAQRLLSERFFRKHAGEVLAGAVTLAGIFVSVANIGVAYMQKEKEDNAQQAQKQAEIAQQKAATADKLELEKLEDLHKTSLAEREYDYKWKQDMLQFVDKHSEQIFSIQRKDTDRMRDIMVVSFPADYVSLLFANLQKTAPADTQKTWTQGQTLAGQLTAQVRQTSPLTDVPPEVSDGQVPMTASECPQVPSAGAANTGCWVGCWEKGRTYNIHKGIGASSKDVCAQTALSTCRRAGNSFCAYSWDDSPKPPVDQKQQH